jgi:hypothetical protein
VSQKIYIQLKNSEKENIELTLETRDSNELILVLGGYYRLLCMRELQVERDEIRDENLLPYCWRHQVTCQGWNYPDNNDSDCLHFVNFGAHPPYQPPPPGENFTTYFEPIFLVKLNWTLKIIPRGIQDCSNFLLVKAVLKTTFATTHPSGFTL